MRWAQHVCARCPVAELCLWSALVVEDPVYRYGVYGGLLPHQRHQLAALCQPRRAAELLELELAWWTRVAA
jgi:Transcription factor WhiB